MGRSNRRGWYSWLGLAAGGVLLLGALALWRTQQPLRPSLSIGIEGCDEFILNAADRRLVCEFSPVTPQHPGPPSTIRVGVQTAPSARITVRSVHTILRYASRTVYEVVAQANEQGIAWVDLMVGANADRVELQAVSASTAVMIGVATIHLRFQEWSPLNDLIDDWKRVDHQDRDAQERVVKKVQALANVLQDGPLHARAELLAARMIYREWQTSRQQGSVPILLERRTEHALSAALSNAEQKGWLGSEAVLATRLAHLLLTVEEPAKQAELSMLLERRLPRLSVLPSELADIHYYLGLNALRSDDLRLARGHLEKGVEEAFRLGSADQAIRIQAHELEVLLLSAPPDEVRTRLALYKREAERATTPCFKALVLGNLGWLLLMIWEQRWPGAEDPLQVLLEALSLRTSSCPDTPAAANILANLARRSSVTGGGTEPITSYQEQGQLAQAEIFLQQVAQILETKPELQKKPWLQMDQMIARGRLALQRQQWASALAHYRQLGEVAHTNHSLLNQWQAKLGAATALEELGDADLALSSYQSAEDLVDTMVRYVRFDTPHSAFLARYEQSARQYLDLLLRKGRLNDAFSLARAARRRAMGQQQLPWWRDFSTSTIAAQREQDWETYRTQRMRFENQLLNHPLPNPEVCQEQRRLRKEWQATFDRMMQGPACHRSNPPSHPDRDIVLTCHPLRQGWACLVAMGKVLETFSLGDINPSSRPEELAKQILNPVLARLLRPDRRLKVLAYGDLHQVDFAALPFDHGTLIESLPVVHAMDRPPVMLPARSGRALVVANPDGTLGSDWHSVLRMLAEPLASFKVTFQGSPAMPAISLPPRWLVRSADSLSIQQNVEGADLFLYVGHVEPMPCHSSLATCMTPDVRLSALCLAEHTSLWSGDLLALKQVPRLSLLVGCESAQRRSSSPPEVISLASSLALRGSQVVGSVRPVSESLAQQLLCGLAHVGLKAMEEDLASALASVQRRLAVGQTCSESGWLRPEGQVEKRSLVDWAAFRVYVP